MTQRPAPVRLYDSTPASGNSYKARLLMARLGIECPVVELDILAKPSETRTQEFLAKNPNGRVPLLELADGTFLAESNAILFYLAEQTDFLPAQPVLRAQTLQWLFFEQYSHEPYIAVLRFWRTWGGLHNKRPDEIALWQERGQQALQVMDTHLRGRAFFVGERCTIADIALYAYTHSAELVGFDLASVPAVRSWLARMADEPGHVLISNGPGSRDWRPTR